MSEVQRPRSKSLFAVNMLVRTAGGGTFSFAELREDLEAVGFEACTTARGQRDMDAIVAAVKA